MIKIFCSHTNDESLNYSDCSPNNCCLTESGVWILCDKLDGIVGSGYKLAFSCSLYDTPMPSSELGIGRYVKSKQYVSGRLTNKAVCFPMERDYIIIPFVWACDEYWWISFIILKIQASIQNEFSLKLHVFGVSAVGECQRNV